MSEAHIRGGIGPFEVLGRGLRPDYLVCRELLQTRTEKAKLKMKKHLIVGLAVVATAIQVKAQSRVVTIVQGAPNQTNSVHIGDFEHVKILSARDVCGGSTVDQDRGKLLITVQSVRIT